MRLVIVCAALAASITLASAQGLTPEMLARRDYQTKVDPITERVFLGAIAERCSHRPLAWFALLLRKSHAEYDEYTAEFRRTHPAIEIGNQSQGAIPAAMLLGQRLVEMKRELTCAQIATPAALSAIDGHIY